MPINNAPHKFAVGQNVVVVPAASDRNVSRGGYVITRTLPGDDFDRSYRVRNIADGSERVYREAQLRLETLWRAP